MGTYIELIQRFPLKVISGDAEHKRALATLGEIIGKGDENINKDEEAYAEVLIMLIEKYESLPS